jgi:hypothetical protein
MKSKKLGAATWALSYVAAGAAAFVGAPQVSAGILLVPDPVWFGLGYGLGEAINSMSPEGSVNELIYHQSSLYMDLCSTL